MIWQKPPKYTHGVMNLGVGVCRCALDSVFLIDDCMVQERFTEKKRRPSRSMPTGM